MKKLSMNFKILVAMILIAIFGICSSIFMIDNYCIKEDTVNIENDIDVVVNVYNESNNVEVEVNDNDDGIDVIIKDKKINADEHDYKETSLRSMCGIIDAESGLNIREDSSIKSEKIGAYCYGETVEIIGEKDDWYITNDGYIYKEYVNVIYFYHL